MKNTFSERQKSLIEQYQNIVERKNKKVKFNKGGVFSRYKFPVLSSEHIPLNWRYDLNEKTNPLLL